MGDAEWRRICSRDCAKWVQGSPTFGVWTRQGVRSCSTCDAEVADLEAIDVAFIQPLKDLHAWWERQSSATKAYINLLTPLIGTGLVVMLSVFHQAL